MDLQAMGEKIAALEALATADKDNREERQHTLDRILVELTTVVNQKTADLATEIKKYEGWVRVQLYGNGTKVGCIDERLKCLERFTATWDWRKAVIGRIVAYAVQGAVLAALLHILKLTK